MKHEVNFMKWLAVEENLHKLGKLVATITVEVDDENIIPVIRLEQQRVKNLAEKIRTRQWRGATNQAITDVVNIGIGGSHLGPLMVTEALRPYTLHDLNIHFVSNIDENHINDTLEYLNPETTFFIIDSGTISTENELI